MPNLPPVASTALDEFASLVRAYCALIERAPHLERGAFLNETHLQLAGLYAAALRLPSIGVLYAADPAQPEEDKQPLPTVVPDPGRGEQDEWLKLVMTFGTLLGEWNNYREVFDPFESSAEPEVTGALAVDLIDIFQELREGLRRFDRGETGEALWEWRFGLEHHWGKHATSALRALHALSPEMGWPEPGTG